MGSNNLLEQFIEFIETFHLLDLQFIMLMKRHTQNSHVAYVERNVWGKQG